MQRLNLPTFPLKIKSEAGRKRIFDEIRKKWLLLTPEEWVRQNFIHYLAHEKKYSASLMAIEYTLTYNNQAKRIDIVVFNTSGTPLIIVECKAPEVKITQQTFDQIAVYNLSLHVDYLIITNGLQHYCCRMNYKEKKYDFLKEIPNFEDIK